MIRSIVSDHALDSWFGAQSNGEPASTSPDCALTSSRLAKQGSNLAFTSWRGVVGNIKPTMRPGSVEELCRILPEGVGIIPLFLDIQRGAREEFTTILKSYEPMIAKLAEHEVDIIHPEGAPPFMVLGYQGEAELLKKWEKTYRTPM